MRELWYNFFEGADTWWQKLGYVLALVFFLGLGFIVSGLSGFLDY